VKRRRDEPEEVGTEVVKGLSIRNELLHASKLWKELWFVVSSRIVEGWVFTVNQSSGRDTTKVPFVEKIGSEFTKTSLTRLKVFPESTVTLPCVILWIVWHPLLFIVRLEHGAIGSLGLSQEVHPTSAIEGISGSWHAMLKETRFDD
jgi:hypothetical protein